MRTCLALCLAALLAGCAKFYPNSPLEQSSPAEARCAAIREFVPFDRRGTSDDPTARRGARCAPQPRAVQGPPAEARGPKYLGRAVYDAGTY